jgi:hypothetical protein
MNAAGGLRFLRDEQQVDAADLKFAAVQITRSPDDGDHPISKGAEQP